MEDARSEDTTCGLMKEQRTRRALFVAFSFLTGTTNETTAATAAFFFFLRAAKPNSRARLFFVFRRMIFEKLTASRGAKRDQGETRRDQGETKERPKRDQRETKERPRPKYQLSVRDETLVVKGAKTTKTRRRAPKGINSESVDVLLRCQAERLGV